MSPQKQAQASPLLVIISFATVYIVWGSTYFFIRVAVHDFPPFLLGAVRFVISGLIMLVICLAKGEKVFNKGSIIQATYSGLLMLFVGNGVVIWVEQYLPSALVAILVSAAPLWFVILDKPKWSENLTSKSTIIGLVIGFMGVIILFYEKIAEAFSAGSGKIGVVSLFLLVLGSICWAGGSLYSKYFSGATSTTVASTWQMLSAGLAFIPCSLLTGEMGSFRWQSVSGDSWLAIAYLIVFGSIAAFSAYVWLLQVRPATQVSTYGYVNPVVAVILGVFFAGESISWVQILGLAVILTSVLLINLAKYRKAEA